MKELNGISDLEKTQEAVTGLLLRAQVALSIYRVPLKFRQKMQNRNKNFSGGCAVTVSKMKSAN